LTLIAPCSKETLDNLLDGYLSDLVTAIMGETIESRDTLRRGLGLYRAIPKSSILTIKVDYGKPTWIRDGGYKRIAPELEKMVLAPSGSGGQAFEARIFAFAVDIPLEEVKRSLAEADPENQWCPGQIEHLLAFGAQHPRVQLDMGVICIGTVIREFPLGKSLPARAGYAYLSHMITGDERTLIMLDCDAVKVSSALNVLAVRRSNS
jgi:hypothetical protein